MNMEFEVGRFTGHTNHLAGKSSLDKFCSEIDFIQNIDGNFLCTICHKYLGKDGEDIDEKYEHIRHHHRGLVEVRKIQIYASK